MVTNFEIFLKEANNTISINGRQFTGKETNKYLICNKGKQSKWISFTAGKQYRLYHYRNNLWLVDDNGNKVTIYDVTLGSWEKKPYKTFTTERGNIDDFTDETIEQYKKRIKAEQFDL